MFHPEIKVLTRIKSGLSVENTCMLFQSSDNLLVVSPTAGLFGGTERVLETLIRQLHPDSRVSIAFLTDGPLLSLAIERGVPCCLIPRVKFRNPIDTIKVVQRLRRYICETNATVTLAWTDFAQLYASPASFKLCESIWWQQSNVDGGVATRLRQLMPSRGVIANSFFVRDQLLSRGFRVHNNPLYPPFENGSYDKILDKNHSRKQLGLPLSSRIIGSVGRLQTWKGFDTFVDAIALVQHRYSDLHAVIVGGPHELELDYESKLRKRIECLGLTKQITLAGSQHNVAMWMSAMDVFVHAAEREPFGMVVPEAMALGLPVIASIPGGPGESLESEKSGLLVRSGNVDDLRAAIERFLSDPEFANSCGTNARVHSRSFSSDGFADRLRESIKEAVR